MNKEIRIGLYVSRRVNESDVSSISCKRDRIGDAEKTRYLCSTCTHPWRYSLVSHFCTGMKSRYSLNAGYNNSFE